MATANKKIILSLALALLGFLLLLPKARPIVRAEDAKGPDISKIKVVNVGSTSTVIAWKTDEPSDSTVNFGITKDFGVTRAPDPSVTDHVVMLQDLEPSTTYFFRVISSDAAGNQSISDGFTFTTTGNKPVPELQTVENQEQKAIAEKAISLIEKISDQTAMEVVSEKLQAASEGVATPPAILGVPDLDVGADTVTIKWETDREANSMVGLASEAQYKAGSDDPYSRHEGNQEEAVLTHTVTLTGLIPSTHYHYQITSQGKLGAAGKSPDRDFTTKSIIPQIYGVKLEKVEEDSATVSWQTQVPASAVVDYVNLLTKQTKSVGDPSFLIAHTIRVPDLKFKTPYQILIRARNQSGDEMLAQPISFITGKDEAPPKISQVNNESTLYPGADSKVQTLISWDTDEPASCQLYYGASTAMTDKDASTLPAEPNPTSKHVQVVTEFAPSTVYKFWIKCADKNKNESRSEDFVLFTPEKEKNIIDIIMENFQGTFGWVKNIGK